MIFNHTWEDIQDIQQKRKVGIVLSNDIPNLPTATDKDKELLVKHGLAGLRKMQFFGVIERLERAAS